MSTCEYCLAELPFHDEDAPINPDDEFNHDCPEMRAALELADLEATELFDSVAASQAAGREAREDLGMEGEDPSLRGEGPDLEPDTKPSIVLLGYDPAAYALDPPPMPPLRIFHEFDKDAAERGLCALPDQAEGEQLDWIGDVVGLKRSDEP